MDDKNNEFQPADSSTSEALSRAERIKAIKNSINKTVQQSSVPETTTDTGETAEASAQDVASEKIPSTNNSQGDSWDDEISERIAKRVQKMKANKSVLSDVIPETASEESDDNSEEDQNAAAENETECADEEISDAEQSEQLAIETEAHDAEDSVEGEAAKKKKTKKKKKKKSLKKSLLDLLPQKKDSIPERIRKVVFLGSCAAIIVCGTIVADYYIDTTHTENIYDEIGNEYLDYSKIPTDQTTPHITEDGEVYTLLPNAERLLEINNEVVGFISIPGTEVAYPVMQSEDLEKYLNKNILGEEAKAGALFLDYRNSFDHVYDGKLLEQNSDNLIIYGHNMENGNMFGTLKNYRNDSSYYGNHPVIQFNSNYKQYQYKIFAFFIVDAEDKTDTAFECWNNINFADETEFYNFVNEAKKRTIRLNDVDVQYGDKLLTLSTCNGIFGKDGPGRLIVLARLVREGEDPYEGTQNSVANPNIKWPSLYYKYNSKEKYDPDAEFVPYGEAATEETTTEE